MDFGIRFVVERRPEGLDGSRFGVGDEREGLRSFHGFYQCLCGGESERISYLVEVLLRIDLLAVHIGGQSQVEFR